MNINKDFLEQAVLFETQDVATNKLRKHILSQGYSNVTVSIDFDAIDRKHHVFVLADDGQNIIQRHFAVEQTTDVV